ncbi:histidine-containing phosphotransfer protein 1 isoform X3 [Benincasa hispida]|uniref:histidine-containing phosphotransfer protein 1 isoform X3 n=1 Tax=Benincasa hispida TaxID=102211 RepID=UPI001900055D|nr:histidine-containing phosphotransfer protein 1 isoform X3 [Benincasa hispida]
MEVGLMQRQWVEYTKSLFLEDFLDSQFIELQKLQDEGNPDFIVEVVSLFFEDSERLLNDLTAAFDQPDVDFQKIDGHVHQLKGSSSRCLRCLQQLKQETCLVKNKLENLFRMEQQIVAAGGSIPATELIF